MRVSRTKARLISQLTIDADVPMATHKLTGLGAGSGNGHSVRYQQLPNVLTIAETEVFSGNSPNPIAWTDLNLSAVVGANKALVMLKVMGTTTAGGVEVMFRQNGDTEINERGMGVSSLFKPTSGNFSYVIVITDASGIIEWHYDLVDDAVTIDVVSFKKVG